MLSVENARLPSRHNISVEDDVTLLEGWVRNTVNGPMVLWLSGKERTVIIIWL